MKNVPNQTRIKSVVWDIEVGPMEVLTFDLKADGYISPEKMQSRPYIICAAWKELGSSKVHSVSVADFPELFELNPRDDSLVVRKLYDAISDADELIAHNGDKFDMKIFNTRAIAHNLGAFPPVKTIDTLKLARRNFKFPSNRLDEIAKYLGLGDKLDSSWDLWTGCYYGDKKAVKKMVKYNKQDVLLLEDVYNELSTWDHSTYHKGAYTGADVLNTCKNCGSTNVQKSGTRVTLNRRYQRLHCQDCGSWTKGEIIKNG